MIPIVTPGIEVVELDNMIILAKKNVVINLLQIIITRGFNVVRPNLAYVHGERT